jgi:hypothetical protein
MSPSVHTATPPTPLKVIGQHPPTAPVAQTVLKVTLTMGSP